MEARLLQRDAGQATGTTAWCSSRAWGRAYELLTGKRLGRSLTADQRPTGPGVRLVRLCLAPLDPLVTDDAIVWAVRRAQTQSWQGIDP